MPCFPSTQALKIAQLVSAATAKPHHTLPRLVVLATSATETLLSASGGTAHLPDIPPGVGEESPITPDSVFYLASCTKLITTIGVLQLVEQGKLELKTDVRGILKDLKGVKLLEGFDEKDTPLLVDVAEPITVWQLLTHTAGFARDDAGPDRAKLVQQGDLPPSSGPTATREAIATRPLAWTPGSRWHYSSSLDWSGFLIEEVSGLSLEEYFKEFIFKPLDIQDTTFDPPSNLINMAHRSSPPDPSAPTLAPGPNFVASPPLCYRGGGGLVGSPSSYLKVLRALLPSYTGPRLLKPSTIDIMFSPQLDETNDAVPLKDLRGFMKSYLDPFSKDLPGEEVKGLNWGLGGALHGEELVSGRRKGALTWAGMANTYWVVDREKDVAFVLFTNVFPFADNTMFETWKQIEPEIYAGLEA
ncbi:beta-lactamase [Pseudohyphozyma bogoriensis]|nr:beta-lactamase [Pseudohyphozyma bogoriensis]